MSSLNSTTESLMRGLKALDLVSRSREGLSLTAIGEQMNLPKGSVHRVMQTLVASGFVYRDPSGGKYKSGEKLTAIAISLLGSLATGPLIESQLRELVKVTGEASNFAVLCGQEMVYVARIESEHFVRVDFKVGTTAPLHCTSIGKVILANMSEARFRQYEEAISGFEGFTPNTVASREQLLERLARIHAQGYSTDIEEYIPGVNSIAVPVWRDGVIVGGVSITGPSNRCPENVLQDWLPHLVEAGKKISIASSGGAF